MKTALPGLAVSLFLTVCVGAAPSPIRIEVKYEPKRQEVKRNYSESTEEAKEERAYRVTILSHTFRESPDLRVEYIVFWSQERSGSKGDAKARRSTGSKALGNLRSSAPSSPCLKLGHGSPKAGCPPVSLRNLAATERCPPVSA